MGGRRRLADYYLQIGCSVMTPNQNRIELLKQMAKDYQVDVGMSADLGQLRTRMEAFVEML